MCAPDLAFRKQARGVAAPSRSSPPEQLSREFFQSAVRSKRGLHQCRGLIVEDGFVAVVHHEAGDVIVIVNLHWPDLAPPPSFVEIAQSEVNAVQDLCSSECRAAGYDEEATVNVVRSSAFEVVPL